MCKVLFQLKSNPPEIRDLETGHCASRFALATEYCKQPRSTRTHHQFPPHRPRTRPASAGIASVEHVPPIRHGASVARPLHIIHIGMDRSFCTSFRSDLQAMSGQLPGEPVRVRGRPRHQGTALQSDQHEPDQHRRAGIDAGHEYAPRR